MLRVQESLKSLHITRAFKRMELLVFERGMTFSAALAKRPRIKMITRVIMRFLANYTLLTKRAQTQDSLAGIIREIQRMFPSSDFFPLMSMDGSDAHIRITRVCPLHGCNDRSACERMMGFERRLLEKIGGEMTIISSQAEPGVHACTITVRKKDS